MTSISPTSTDLKHSVDLSLPFPTRTLAEHAASVLKVDRELRPMDVVKVFDIQNQHQQGAGEVQKRKGALLNITLKATTLRHLRISTNALLEDLALIIRTMDAFLPQDQRQELNSDLKEEADKLKGFRIEKDQAEEERSGRVGEEVEEREEKEIGKAGEEEDEFEQGKVGIAG